MGDRGDSRSLSYQAPLEVSRIVVIALLERRGDGKRIALAVLTRNSPSMDYAKQTIEGVAARVLRRNRLR
jgi:hypothetical protein